MKTVLTDLEEIVSNKELLKCFDEKKVLITGSNGLIGSMLIQTFDYANKKYGYNIDIYGHARNQERVKAVLGDTADNITMIYANDFRFQVECDYIFHTASPTSSKTFINNPVEVIDIILAGTKQMLNLAKKNNAVFVYLSSMEEYGIPYKPGDIMTEDKVGMINHLSARSCYPEAKRMCECMCAAYTAEYSVKTKIVRLAQCFGAGIPLTDNRVSMQFARSVVEKRNIILHTEGNSISNFCYLSDAIAGILSIAIKGNVGEAYNVCNDIESRSISDIANLVCQKVANGCIKVEKNIQRDNSFGYAPDNTMRLNSDKLKNLGWFPKVCMKEGYKRLVRYIEEENSDA